MKHKQEPKLRDIIKWDIAKARKKTAERQIRKAKEIAGRLYHEWRSSITLAQTSRDAFYQSLLDFKNGLKAAITQEGMEDWLEFTLNLIDEKLERINTGNLWPVNRLTEFPSADLRVTTRAHTFRTANEFYELPVIKAHTNREDFVGFLWHEKQITALYEDGEPIPVGRVDNLSGLPSDIIPLKVYLNALHEKPAPAQPEPGSGQPGAPGPDPDPATTEPAQPSGSAPAEPGPSDSGPGESPAGPAPEPGQATPVS